MPDPKILLQIGVVAQIIGLPKRILRDPKLPLTRPGPGWLQLGPREFVALSAACAARRCVTPPRKLARIVELVLLGFTRADADPSISPFLVFDIREGWCRPLGVVRPGRPVPPSGTFIMDLEGAERQYRDAITRGLTPATAPVVEVQTDGTPEDVPDGIPGLDGFPRSPSIGSLDSVAKELPA